jgi:hypothetical protein
LILLFAAALASQATPRYAARYEQSCHLCHDDPSGGGKRSLYTAQFILPAELVSFPPGPEALEAIDPRIGNNLSVGCDLRTIFHESEDDAGEQGFLQMQGSVYFAFDPDPRYALYFTRGITGNYEAFGMARVLPAHGYVKAGRFVPPYGWRFADHTAYVREHGGFFPPAHSDVGLEAGIFPGRFSAQVAVVNGARGNLRDADSDLAASGLLLGRFRLAGVALATGGSFTLHPRDAAGVRREGGGLCGSLSVGRLTWVGQSDWLQDERAEERTTGWLVSQEFSGRLERGLDLLVTHDFQDFDLDLKTGARERWGAGAEWRPSAFAQLRVMLQRVRVDAGPALAADDLWQGEAQVHFLY